MSASIGSRVGASPGILAGLTGPIGNKLRRRLPKSSIISELGYNLREIRDTWGVTKEGMADIVPESCSERGLGAEGGLAPRPPEAGVLAAHDAITTNSRKAQKKLANLVN